VTTNLLDVSVAPCACYAQQARLNITYR